jgi:hypothetical protein
MLCINNCGSSHQKYTSLIFLQNAFSLIFNTYIYQLNTTAFHAISTQSVHNPLLQMCTKATSPLIQTKAVPEDSKCKQIATALPTTENQKK